MTRIDTRIEEWRKNGRPKRLFIPGTRVLLDGVDVTNECFLADDDMNVVGLYLRDASGHFYMDPATFDAAQEMRNGTVTFLIPSVAT